MIPVDRTFNQMRCVAIRCLGLALALVGAAGPGDFSAADQTGTAAPVDEQAPEEFPQPIQAERAAAEAVRALGGWYALAAEKHVVEVNMVYHEDPSGRRHDNNQTTDAVLRHLPDFPRLEMLALKDGQASDEGLVFVGKLPQLQKLYIFNGREVTDKGIANLQRLAKLDYLHLSGSQVTDEAILHLSNVQSVEGVSMQQNSFTDKALEYAARMPRLKSLVLDLGARFTDEGMQRIRGMPMLEEIWLQKTGISEAGLKALHGLKTLKLVVLHDDEFAAKGDTAIEELRQATPTVRVKQGIKLLPSINALAVADDPKLQETVGRDATEGLKIIERFLALLETKQDSKAFELTRRDRRDILVRMQGLRLQPDFEPLKVSVASGNGEIVQALTTPAVVRESFDAQGNVREKRMAFVGLTAKKKSGTWRIEFINFQDEGSNTWMERFLSEQPDAQKVR
jgi:hypothetical protein